MNANPSTVIGEEVPALESGMVFRSVSSIPFINSDGIVESESTADGVVLISQPCDVVRADKLQVAKIVHIEDSKAHLARKGYSPQYIPLPAIGADLFADLSLISTIHREHLEVQQRIGTLTDSDGMRLFRLNVARRFGRAALPDSVSEWLRQLSSIFKKSQSKSNALWDALASIQQIRIQLDSWEQQPTSIQLWIITNVGVLPAFPDDEVPARPDNVTCLLTESSGQLDEKAANALKQLQLTDAERYYLWQDLAEGFIQRCQVKATKNKFSATATVVMADEYTLAQMADSEQIDFEYLSSSVNAVDEES